LRRKVANLSDAQWNFRASPERWSVAQVAEHIMLAEDGISAVVQRTMAAPADPEAEAKTARKAALLERVLLDRSGKAKAPEQLQPQSKLTREQIVQQFQASRAKTIEFAKTTDLDLKSHTSPNPFFGPLNAYDWLIYIPLHQLRHDQQIAEVKAAPGFPKSQ
jgi:hypothetical protein